MRIQNSGIVTTSCFSTMEGKDLNGTSISETDLKFSPTNNDTASSNGILSPPTTPSTTTLSENDYSPAPSGSGRFKFFKDGKVILELWHHRNGERVFWIPVSKNSTCWPSTGHCTPRQESSTSLSVSDDNSSIQSSPWQRDHCWKQVLPRKNINRELEFMMNFLKPRKIRLLSAVVRRRRRKPYDLIKFDYNLVIKGEIKEEIDNITTKNELKSLEKDNPNRKFSITDNKVNEQEYFKKKQFTTNFSKGKKKLSEIALKLMERKSHEATSNSCRTDPGIVSPRKRILKEMEKVSLEEMGNANKKYRARTVGNTACNTVSVIAGTTSGQIVTSATHTATTFSTTKSTSSHSISSILSRDEEPSFLRNLLKSPNDTSAEPKSSFTAEPSSISDVRINRPHCSTPVTSSLSPPYSSKNLHCPQPLSPYIPSTYLYHTTQPFLASSPISNHPPYFPSFPGNFRDCSMWPMHPASSLSRQSVYPSTSISSYPTLNPSPWVPVAHSSLQSYSLSENGTDVPLNLSKH